MLNIGILREHDRDPSRMGTWLRMAGGSLAERHDTRQHGPARARYPDAVAHPSTPPSISRSRARRISRAASESRSDKDMTVTAYSVLVGSTALCKK